MQDTVLATVTFLNIDAGVRAVFNDPIDLARVYGAELPEEQAQYMPRKAIVVRRFSGTGGMGGRLKLEQGILDVICYAETPLEAERLRGAVRDALRECLRVVKNNTLLHSFEPSGAPVQSRDRDTDWPYIVEPWLFLASESAA